MSTKLKENLEIKLKALDEKKELFKDNHTDIAFALYELGNAYKDLSDYDNNLKCQLESLEMYKSIYKNKDHAFVAASYGNVGNN
jgi:tetratricopeptide (TPR) repeat protein